MEPSEETVALYDEIRSGARSAIQQDARGTRKSNLAAQATAFVGRAAELNRIDEQLNDPDCRLLTLLGPGGIGKTRLALQAAAEEIHNYRDGVWFVQLAGVASTELLAPAIAVALGFAFSSTDEPETQLQNYLREKSLLLLLDNFEHLLPGSKLVTDLLARAPNVQILITSRERLKLHWERLLKLSGMGFPKAEDNISTLEDHDSTRLFLQSARRIDLDFAPDDTAVAAVVGICRLLEGLPLGIELAAAMLWQYTPQQIEQEIGANLTRLETLMQDVPERHRSLRVVCEQSLALLSTAEQELFGKLSVFAGGFEAVAAQAVAAATVSSLSALTDKSLLRRTADGRYEMHEMLREFAAENLMGGAASMDAVSARHSTYYLEMLAGREPDLYGAAQKTALLALSTDIANIRASWDYAVNSAHIDALHRSARALYLLYYVLGWFQEGAASFRQSVRALQDQSGIDESLTLLLALHGALESEVSAFGSAITALQRALDLAERGGHDREAAFCLAKLGRVQFYQGDYEQARRYASKALILAQQANLQSESAQAHLVLGMVAVGEANHQEAIEHLENALTIYRRLNHYLDTAFTLNRLGVTLLILKQHHKARKRLENSLEIYRTMDIQHGISAVLCNLGLLDWQIGNHSDARKEFEQSLVMELDIGDPWGIANCHANLGHLGCTEGRFAEALSHYYEALPIARDVKADALVLEIISGMAAPIARHNGEIERAITILEFALHHPATDGWTQRDGEKLLRELKAEVPSERVAVAVEDGKSFVLDSVIQTLLKNA